MTRKKPLKETKDPITKMFTSIQEIGWTVLIPSPDKENDVVYGILVGEDEWVDLVRSYLPQNFGEIVDRKLNPHKYTEKNPEIQEAVVVEEKINE